MCADVGISVCESVCTCVRVCVTMHVCVCAFVNIYICALLNGCEPACVRVGVKVKVCVEWEDLSFSKPGAQGGTARGSQT